MGKLILHNNPDPNQLEKERAMRFSSLPPEEKWKQFFALQELSILLNHGQPLRRPQGKGFVLKKINKNER